MPARPAREALRKPDNLLEILIATEKLLTGFDAPILSCLYLDKPMRDHILLQTLARVNLPYEDAEGRRTPATIPPGSPLPLAGADVGEAESCVAQRGGG